MTTPDPQKQTEKLFTDPEWQKRADDPKAQEAIKEGLPNLLTPEKGYLQKVIDDVTLFYRMLFDKSFRMKKEARRALLIALLYLISPIDLIPDWLPFVGRLDDLFVLAVAGKIASEEIARYKLHLATAKQELKPEKA